MWLVVAAVWYFIGMLCFYHIADFSKPDWGTAYYLWDKAKDLLFAGAIVYNIPRSKFKIIFYFCIIRLVWEIAALTLNSDINNGRVIDWLFLLFVGIWVYQLSSEWQKLK